MQRLRAFVVLSRPHFLLGGLLLFALGAATAADRSVGDYVLAQLMVTAAQLTAHFVNEYFDQVPDALIEKRTLFSGGSGILPGGDLQPRVALGAAAAASALAAAAAIAVAALSPTAAALGMAALGISWAYSAPPLRLLGTGWGEMATSAVVTGFVPAIAALALGGGVGSFLWWAMAVLFPTHMAMMLAFELPDIESDALAGKRVIAVRVGRDNTNLLITALYAAALLTLIAGVAAGSLPTNAAAGAALAILPAAAVTRLAGTDRHGWLTAAAVAVVVVAALGLLLGAPVVPRS